MPDGPVAPWNKNEKKQKREREREREKKTKYTQIKNNGTKRGQIKKCKNILKIYWIQKFALYVVQNEKIDKNENEIQNGKKKVKWNSNTTTEMDVKWKDEKPQKKKTSSRSVPTTNIVN